MKACLFDNQWYSTSIIRVQYPPAHTYIRKSSVRISSSLCSKPPSSGHFARVCSCESHYLLCIIIMDAAQAAAVLPVLVDPAAVAGLTAVTNNFVAATMNSLFMILVTEIGDKTFFIAAILAMRHGRLVVYAGAMGK